MIINKGSSASGGADTALIIDAVNGKMSIAFVDENDNPIDYTDESLGGRPMILVPGTPPRIRVGAVAPFTQSGLTEVREGTGGLRYMNGETMVGLYEVLDHEDPVEGAFNVSGRDATYHFFEATDDFTLQALTSAPLGIHIVYILGGADGPHTGSFGAGVQLPPELPGGGDLTFPLATGKLAAILLHRFDAGGVAYQVVLQCTVLNDSLPRAPEFIGAQITPDSGPIGTEYTVTWDVDGNPPPAVSIQWQLNAADVGGAISSKWVSTNDGPIKVLLEATNSTDPFTDAIDADARCGAPQPVHIGETVLYRSGAIGASSQGLVLPASYALGDRVTLIYAIQTADVIAAPAGFTKKSGDIVRVDSASGNNVRCCVMEMILDADHITFANANAGALGKADDGQIAISMTDNSFIALELDRGAGTIIFDSTQFNRSGGQNANSIAVEDAPVATNPAIAYAVLVTSHFNLYGAIATLPGWTKQTVVTADSDGAGRQGGVVFRRQISTGQVPAGTIDASANPAVARFTTFTVLIEE